MRDERLALAAAPAIKQGSGGMWMTLPARKTLLQFPKIERWRSDHLLSCQVSGELCFTANFDLSDGNGHELVAHTEKAANG